MNAYRMLEDLRDNVGEQVAAKWDDPKLLRELNKSQDKAKKLFMQAPGDWLVSSESVTPSSSVITLPRKCAKPVHLEETSSKAEISFDTTVRERMLTRAAPSGLDGGTLDAYMLKDSIVVNRTGYATVCTLWYELRIPKLNAGTASAGGAKSITLINEPSLIDDYYNGVGIEIVSGTGEETRTTIDDYTGSTLTATTVAGTFSESSIYGTISELPGDGEEVEEFILLDATCKLLAQPASAIDPKYFQFFVNERNAARKDMIAWLAKRVSGSQRVRTTEYE